MSIIAKKTFKQYKLPYREEDCYFLEHSEFDDKILNSYMMTIIYYCGNYFEWDTIMHHVYNIFPGIYINERVFKIVYKSSPKTFSFSSFYVTLLTVFPQLHCETNDMYGILTSRSDADMLKLYVAASAFLNI